MNTDRNTLMRPNSWLWACAIVLCGLILFQLGRAPWRGATASAGDAAVAGMMGVDMVNRVGDFSIMSFDAGNEDVVVVLDGRSDDLFAYHIRNQKDLVFLQKVSIPSIFDTLRPPAGPSR